MGNGNSDGSSLEESCNVVHTKSIEIHISTTGIISGIKHRKGLINPWECTNASFDENELDCGIKLLIDEYLLGDL